MPVSFMTTVHKFKVCAYEVSAYMGGTEWDKVAKTRSEPGQIARPFLELAWFHNNYDTV